MFLCLFPIVATCLLFWSAFHDHLDHDDNHPSAPHRWRNCGSSPTEAKLRGCRFDILSFAWQTPECFDGELMDDFIAHDNWKFYAHFNSTETVVELAAALEGDRSLYVDWEYHITHCTFMWRQMHRAYTVKGFIDSHLDDYHHTLHCQRTLLDRETGLGMVNVIAALKYPDCRKISGSEAGSEEGLEKGLEAQRHGKSVYFV